MVPLAITHVVVQSLDTCEQLQISSRPRRPSQASSTQLTPVDLKRRAVEEPLDEQAIQRSTLKRVRRLVDEVRHGGREGAEKMAVEEGSTEG